MNSLNNSLFSTTAFGRQQTLRFLSAMFRVPYFGLRHWASERLHPKMNSRWFIYRWFQPVDSFTLTNSAVLWSIQVSFDRVISGLTFLQGRCWEGPLRDIMASVVGNLATWLLVLSCFWLQTLTFSDIKLHIWGCWQPDSYISAPQLEFLFLSRHQRFGDCLTNQR